LSDYDTIRLEQLVSLIDKITNHKKVTVHAKEKKSYALKGQRMLTHRIAVG
jgi:hypothetical protein